MDNSKCLDKRQLLAYLGGSLSAVEAQSVEEHLAACERCEAALQIQDGLSDALFAAFHQSEADSESYDSESQLREALKAVEMIAETERVIESPLMAPVSGVKPTPDSADVPPPRAAEDAAITPALRLPRTVGEYELLQCLGTGGMGTVYKARHLRLNRIVAVKMMRENRLEDATAAARFDREMKSVGALDHANIVRATDAREVDGQRLLVMELVDGLDLALLAGRAGPLRIADACEIIRQTALGLQSAHHSGVVHRDIKPSNIMLARSGQVKVLDLGLALFHEQLPTAEEVTHEGQAVGTAEYTAPEQISDSHRVDSRADIYSLGCTFFRLLTGESPFQGPRYKTRVEKLSAHLRLPVPDVRTLRPEVPEELAELLKSMTAISPAARSSSMAEVAGALVKFCSGQDLPCLLKRAEDAGKRAASDARTDELCSSALVSTSSSKRLHPLGANELPEMKAVATPSGGRRRRWPRALALGAMAAGALLAAFLIVRWRDSTGRETTVETSEPSSVTISKDGAVSILPMQGTGKGLPSPADSSAQNHSEPATPAAETVALQDFFKDVPGRWVPVLTSEKDLAGCQLAGPDPAIPATGGVTFQSGVVDVNSRVVWLRSFRSSVQGIRAKVKWIGDASDLCLRYGSDGFFMAYFYQGGWMGMGGSFHQNNKGMWTDLRGGLTPAKARDRFVPIGFAAIGDRLVCEVDGNCQFTMMDKRIGFGSPGIGTKNGRRAFFKDIEVFVPDKDFDKVPHPTSGVAGALEITNTIGAALVRVKPGQFYMGSPKDEPHHLAGEDLHDVKISKPFYIGQCEITQEQYQAVMGANPSSFSATGRNSDLVKGQDTRRYPVECVSWDDARMFCEKLSAREHRQYRLPTEAEWEYCCRAATDTPFCFGGGINVNNANANQSYGGPMKVGEFPENKWGLCDMHGNVAEWCQDYFSAAYYQESPAADPTGPASGVNRVVRGGSWNVPGSRCRSAARFSEPPSTRRDDLGFRIVAE